MTILKNQEMMIEKLLNQSSRGSNCSTAVISSKFNKKIVTEMGFPVRDVKEFNNANSQLKNKEKKKEFVSMIS